MSAIDIRNARIVSTKFGFEDHGVFTFYLCLDYGDAMIQSAGGYCLDEHDDKTKTRRGDPRAIELISRILAVAGVKEWEQLPGKFIRVRQDHSTVYAIGHMLKDKWLVFDEFFERDRK